MSVITNLISIAAPPSGARLGRRVGRGTLGDRWQLRLIITVPSLLAVFTLCYAVVSYLTFLNYWDELAMKGASGIASRMLHIHLVAMLGLTAIAVLMGMALCYSILRPIRAVADAARMVAQGRLDRHAPQHPSVPELEVLAQSFNAMLDTLNRSIAERNRQLIEGIPIGVLMTDVEGRVNALNAAAATMLAVEPGTLIGCRIDEVQGSLSWIFRQMHELTPSDGAETPESSRRITLEGEDGNAIEVSAGYLREQNGRSRGVVYHFRESARVRRVSKQLNQADQLAALGTFTIGVAHHLRNPLGAIKGLGQLLSEESDLPEGSRSCLDRMIREVDRVDVFVRELLDLTSQPIDQPAPVRLQMILEGAFHRAVGQVGASEAGSVSVSWEIDETMPLLELEADRLQDAFARLLRNAFEAAEADGWIQVGTHWNPRQKGGRAEVRILNGGTPIDPKDRERVFEPFFTTRPQALGLGLTIAQQVILQNDGHIELNHRTNGTEVCVSFEPVRVAARKGAPSDAL